jgi:hypothetical protein
MYSVINPSTRPSNLSILRSLEVPVSMSKKSMKIRLQTSFQQCGKILKKIFARTSHKSIPKKKRIEISSTILNPEPPSTFGKSQFFSQNQIYNNTFLIEGLGELEPKSKILFPCYKCISLTKISSEPTFAFINRIDKHATSTANDNELARKQIPREFKRN